MINNSILWTMIAAVPLALVGTILISIFVTAQIAESDTTYTNLGYDINSAPTLTLVPESAQQQGYEFVNGINRMETFGFTYVYLLPMPFSEYKISTLFCLTLIYAQIIIQKR